MKLKNLLIVSSFLLIFVIAGCRAPQSNVNLDSFAQCLTDKDVKFFGAYWCPHCASQKSLFGDSFEHVNYIECSLPGRAGETQICIDENINTYPTWEFPSGERVEGQLSILQLSQLSGCALTPTE